MEDGTMAENNDKRYRLRVSITLEDGTYPSMLIHDVDRTENFVINKETRGVSLKQRINTILNISTRDMNMAVEEFFID